MIVSKRLRGFDMERELQFKNVSSCDIAVYNKRNSAIGAMLKGFEDKRWAFIANGLHFFDADELLIIGNKLNELNEKENKNESKNESKREKSCF